MIDMIELYKRAMVVGMCVFLWWVLWATLGCSSFNIERNAPLIDLEVHDSANGNTVPLVP